MFAVTILRILAWVILVLGLVATVLLILGASVITPLAPNLPQGAPGSPLILLTAIPIIITLSVALFWWALLICIASITDDLHDMRSRQR